MLDTIDIDALYRVFCERLPSTEQSVTRALAFRLNLAPTPEIAWSSVFKHPVTLAAPAYFAAAMPQTDPCVTQKAVFAHMLAVIEAFGTDRIADGQVADEPNLRRVLASLRAARDEAIAEIGGNAALILTRAADEETSRAIVAERSLLLRGEPVGEEVYEAVSAGKQAVGLPATVALASAFGWKGRRVQTVRSILKCIWLGLQFLDDVADWEQDAANGGAWAVVLAQHRATASGITMPSPARLSVQGQKSLVFSSGTLPRMLERSLRHFRQARAGATSIGAEKLAEWIRARELEVLDLYEHEERSPGYVVRRRELQLWAHEVFR